jgi:transposase
MIYPPSSRKMMDVLGIDLAKLSFDATLLQAASSYYASFPNTPEGFRQLHSWLNQHDVSRLHACMEATNSYWQALATWLHAHDYIVSVVNPARSKGYAMATMQRNKTDKRDSALIARFCAKHQPNAWQPASEEQQRLRALVRHRDDLLHTS